MSHWTYFVNSARVKSRSYVQLLSSNDFNRTGWCNDLSSDGKWGIVGSYDGANSNAFIVRRDENGKASLFQTISSSVSESPSNYSYDVAISDDGLVCVVTDRYAGSQLKGSVEVYTRSNDLQQFTLFQRFDFADTSNAPTLYCQFGFSCDISYDGKVIAIGGIRDATRGGNSGAVLLYARAESGNKLYQHSDTLYVPLSENFASPAYFGQSVHFSKFHAKFGAAFYQLSISAPFIFANGTDYAGKVFFASVSSNGLGSIGDIPPIGGDSNDSLGYRVSASDDGTVIGCTKSSSDESFVYVYDSAANKYNMKLVTNHTASGSVSISGDGNLAAFGWHNYDEPTIVDCGAIRLFQRDSNDNFNYLETIVASDAAAYDGFGWSLSLSDDGTNILVGTYLDDSVGPNQGQIYYYTR